MRPLRLVLRSAIDAGTDAASPGEIVYDEADWSAYIYPSTPLDTVGARNTRRPAILIRDEYVPKLPNLLEVLSALGGECRENNLVVHMSVTLDKWTHGMPYVGEPPPWRRVQVILFRDIVDYYFVYETVDDERIVSDFNASLADAVADYRARKTSRGQLVASMTDKQLAHWKRNRRRYLLPDWTMRRRARIATFEGPTATRAEQLDRLYPRFLRSVSVSYVDVAIGRELLWMEGARFRWPFSFSIIRDVVMIFSHLPAYVLLWILDWLPTMHLWREARKIELIQGLIASIRCVRAKRIE